MKYPRRIIRINEKDNRIVKAIQKQLIKRGTYLHIDGIFGSLTESSVKYFQAVSHDNTGNPLLIDGEIGPITWASLFDDAQCDELDRFGCLLQKVIEYADLELGIMESPPFSNRGKEVEEYLKSVDLMPGNNWCTAFIYWCFFKASESLGIFNPVYRTGNCIDHWENSSAKKIPAADASANPALIKKGHIFIMDHGCGKGHTGLVIHADNGFITTIEGHSNPEDPRRGLGVFRLKRKINTVNLGFLDYGLEE